MRVSRDEACMAVARIWATRTTCLRRGVGCLLVDADGRTLSSGHNGVAKGQPHCNQSDATMARAVGNPPDVRLEGVKYPHACPAALAKSGTMLDGCHAIHAEQNALMFCPDVMRIHTCYVTTSPCITCTKMLLNTSCERIVFDELYPHAEATKLWEDAGREWHQHVRP